VAAGQPAPHHLSTSSQPAGPHQENTRSSGKLVAAPLDVLLATSIKLQLAAAAQCLVAGELQQVRARVTSECWQWLPLPRPTPS